MTSSNPVEMDSRQHPGFKAGKLRPKRPSPPMLLMMLTLAALLVGLVTTHACHRSQPLRIQSIPEDAPSTETRTGPIDPLRLWVRSPG